MTDKTDSPKLTRAGLREFRRAANKDWVKPARCPPHGLFKKIDGEYRCGFCGARDVQVCVVCCRVTGTCEHDCPP